MHNALYQETVISLSLANSKFMPGLAFIDVKADSDILGIIYQESRNIDFMDGLGPFSIMSNQYLAS